MHLSLLSPYHPGTGPVHRLPAWAKLAAAAALVVAVVLLPRRAGMMYGLCAAFLVAVAAHSRVPARRLALKLLALEPFVLGVALLALFQPGGAVVFAEMLAKSTLCLFTMVLLASTTRFSDILAVLWRLRVPALLVTSLALMYRYLAVLVDESVRMARARRSRSFTPRRSAAWRASASVAAQVFVRSTERAERIYSAMLARGWRT